MRCPRWDFTRGATPCRNDNQRLPRLKSRSAAARSRRACASRCPRTIWHGATPGSDGDVALGSEVEVIDAGHPLFGRRFRLVSVLGPAHPQARLRVAYGDGLFLTLPLEATDLAPRSPPPCGTACKLSVEALRDLLTVAGETVAPCRSNPSNSGPSCRCRPGSAGRSPRISRQLSGR